MSHSDLPPASHDNDSIAATSPTRSAHEVRWSARALVISASVLVAIALAPIAVGLASALVLYEICARPNAWMARRLPTRLAAALTAIVAFGIIAVPLVWLGHHLSTRLPAVLAALTAFRTPAAADSASGMMAQLQVQAAHAASSASDWLPGSLLPLVRNTASALINWSIALLGLYYLLGSPSASWPRFARVLPLSPGGAESLRVRLHDVTEGVVAGTLLSAAVQGSAIGIGFWLAGLPDALFWGACAAIATLVPVVGNALVWVPALLLVILRQQYDGAIFIGIFGGLFPPVIDRVVRATVSRHVGRVHPMITLVGALAGMRVAGVAGIMLGPVALAMFFALLEVYNIEFVG